MATATRQSFITALPGGPNGASSDTWETLAARATQLADTHISPADLIAANVERGADPATINQWIASIGGALSGDGFNWILPAGVQVKLPAGAFVPVEDALVIDHNDAGALLVQNGPSPYDTGSKVIFYGGIAAGALLVLYNLLSKGKRASSRGRSVFGGLRRRSPRRRRVASR